MVEGATIFAQNAKAGGVNVTVKNVDGGTIYGDQYLKWPFSADYWGTRNYLLQAATGVLKTAPFNETHWDAYSGYSKFESLYRQALGTVDEKKRAQIIKEMQRMEYNDGGSDHLGLQEPHRRLLREGRRLQGRPRHAQPQQVRQRLPDHLLRVRTRRVPGREARHPVRHADSASTEPRRDVDHGDRQGRLRAATSRVSDEFRRQ